jgi:3'(2'), 5'-bisphosphate nucleotidase
MKQKHQEVETVSKGSSLKLCLIAEGKADVYPRFAPTMEWDTAAGHAIIRAMGKEVYQAGTQHPLEYNKEDLLNPWEKKSIRPAPNILWNTIKKTC